MSKKTLKIVEIEWVDAVVREDVSLDTPSLCVVVRSVGYLVKDTDDEIWLAHSVDGELCDVLAVPKSCVRSFKVIK